MWCAGIGSIVLDNDVSAVFMIVGAISISPESTGHTEMSPTKAGGNDDRL